MQEFKKILEFVGNELEKRREPDRVKFEQRIQSIDETSSKIKKILDFEITALPAYHWSRRLGQKRNQSLWCGYLIKENYNKSVSIEGVLLTMVDKRNSLSTIVEKDVRSHLGDKVYKTTIPRNVKVSEAPSHGKPALVYDTHCAGSLAYIQLAKEVILNQNDK